MFLPVYNLAQKRGIAWPGHEQKLNKYDVKQRNKAKNSICRRLDKKLKNIYEMSLVNNRAMEVLFRISA
jgi:hypothetical protein